jgi:hypothetical protein
MSLLTSGTLLGSGIGVSGASERQKEAYEAGNEFVAMTRQTDPSAMFIKAENVFEKITHVANALPQETPAEQDIKARIISSIQPARDIVASVKANTLYKSVGKLPGVITDADIDAAILEMINYNFTTNSWDPAHTPTDNNMVKNFVRTVVLRDIFRYNSGIGITETGQHSPGVTALDKIYKTYGDFLLSCRLGQTWATNLRVPRYAELSKCISESYKIMSDKPQVPQDKKARYTIVKTFIQRNELVNLRELIKREFPGLNSPGGLAHAAAALVAARSAAAGGAGGASSAASTVLAPGGASTLPTAAPLVVAPSTAGGGAGGASVPSTAGGGAGGASAPSTTAPLVVAPSTAAGGASASSTTAPLVVAPSTAAGGASAPSTAAGGASAPSTTAPLVVAPSTAGAGGGAPSTSVPPGPPRPFAANLLARVATRGAAGGPSSTAGAGGGAPSTAVPPGPPRPFAANLLARAGGLRPTTPRAGGSSSASATPPAAGGLGAMVSANPRFAALSAATAATRPRSDTEESDWNPDGGARRTRKRKMNRRRKTGKRSKPSRPSQSF